VTVHDANQAVVDLMAAPAASQVIADLLVEMARSVQVDGDWSGYNQFNIHKAVWQEFDKYTSAVMSADVTGPHGQRRELLQLAVVALKGYVRLGVRG